LTLSGFAKQSAINRQTQGEGPVSDDSSITHVSDTALWVAHFRAMEARRSNAIFADPLASLLAGERGRKIARSFPGSGSVAWGTVVRTSAIDRLIGEALELGIDTVFNLGAGLDTRPYRMRLPAHLRWIELDFPGLMESKRSKLLRYKPMCHLERVGIDLLDRSSRTSVFAQYGSGSRSTLLITEGVIPFISAPDVEILARDLAAVRSFSFWIADFANLTSQRTVPRSWKSRLKAAPYLFEAADWIAFFNRTGWRSRKIVTTGEESERINRPYPLTFPRGVLMRVLPREVRKRLLDLSGVVLMQTGQSSD
jgi:methyltransferase (TIGR00027 family)